MKAFRRWRIPRRIVGLSAALTAAALVGCDQKPAGPKRSDHEAAHTPRFHPDVPRADATGTTAPATAHAVTQPSDITFADLGLVGCPVLFVNSETVTVQEVLEPIIQDLTQKAASMPLAGYRNHVFRTVNNQIDFVISMIVLNQEAKDKYSDEKQQQAFDKEADRLARDVVNRRFGGVTTRYEAHLKALGLTMDDIKARAKRQAMVTQFLHDQFKPMATDPSRRELLRYYQTHMDEFSSPPRAQLLLIEIPLDKLLDKPLHRASRDEVQRARSEARVQLARAREELESGVDFASVARGYSKGIRAGQGGDWGEITPGSLTGRWAKADEVLFTLRPGQVSDVVDAGDAMFLIKCGSFTPGHKLGFEEAQEKIIVRLADEEFNRRRDEYVMDLLNKATIRKRQEFFEAVLATVPRPAALTGPSSP
ncbi:MAG TPA: peptidyl-prolyl cis-trans isomerase [Phycisphaerae bacterium]|nr:peptidyl-prolyl cis-trans isomerase [Phycisphaerae bacterium]